MKPGNAVLRYLLFVFFLCGITSNAVAADYEGVKVTQIKKSTTTSYGGRLSYIRTDKPEVTVLVVELPPGGETGWHIHPVPVYAYVLSGSLTIDLGDGEKHKFKEGDAIIEAVDTPHNGMNTGEVPVRLVVFYTGEQGKPTTIKIRPDNK